MAGFVLFGGSVSARAVQWSWEWVPDAMEASPAVTICPYKYAKTLAYAIEIDDGPSSVLPAAQFFANYKYTDAPPGVSGGTQKPIVGSAASFIKRLQGNSAYVTFAELRQIITMGWQTSNHSYAHSFSSGSPGTAAQMREDHFWSQAIYALETGNGRGLSHFVYPNGWLGYQGNITGGSNDGLYFNEFGFRSGSLVGGSGGNKPYAVNAKMREFNRNNLDGIGPANPMVDFPTTLTGGEFIIDFTHNVDPSPTSNNKLGWTTRMTTMANTYGAGGSDILWSAPSGEVFDYTAAKKVATASVIPGRVRLNIPDTAPGAGLTLKLTNIPVGSVIAAPPGGVVYRSGTTVWLTTPFLGQQGTTLPYPRVKRVYQGSISGGANPLTISLSGAMRLAGVQIHQVGNPADPFKVDLNLVGGGTQNLVTTNLPENYGDINLYSLSPVTAVASLPQVTAVKVNTGSGLSDISIWVVDEAVTSWSAWQTANFTTGEISSGAATDTADFDGDGLSNLMEYALGTAPKQANASGLASPVVDFNGYMRMSFPRDANKPDVTYTVESTSDLSNAANWSILAQSAGGAVTVNNGALMVNEVGAGNIKTVTVFDSRPSSGFAKRFMRLRVSR